MTCSYETERIGEDRDRLDIPEVASSNPVPATSVSPTQVIPEGAGPVKTNGCVVLVGSVSFLVLAGRVEVGVGVKARAEPDRVAAVGPWRRRRSAHAVQDRKIDRGLSLLSAGEYVVVDVFMCGFPGAGQAMGCRSFLRRGVRHEAVRRVTVVGINQRGDLAGFGGHDLHDPRRP
jgi:hypothetical protein